MAIRWVSTPDSRANNEPSVLATAETLLAMIASVWIAWKFHTYAHIAIGASIAPLLLMKTDASCVRSQAIYSRMEATLLTRAGDFTVHPNKIMILLRLGLYTLLALLYMVHGFLIARVLGWLTTILRNPKQSVLSIPRNWSNAALAVDSATWPDVLPPPHGTEERSINRYPHVGHVIEVTKRITIDSPRIVAELAQWERLPTPVKAFVKVSSIVISVPIFTAFALLWIIPSFLYCWSLKSTAIIWFPLLWALRSVRSASSPLLLFFTIYVRDPISKIVVAASVLSIIAFAAKLVLWSEWNGFVTWWHESPLRQALSLYVAPAEVQKWQWAVAINSAIAIGMYLLAGRWLVWLEHDHFKHERWARRAFQVGLFIRRILSCYTIACTLYITIRAASQWSLPPLGENWFPWQ